MTEQETPMLQVIKELTERTLASEQNLADTQKTLRTVVWSGASVLFAFGVAALVVLQKYPMDRYIYTDNAKEICEAQTYEAPLVTTNTVTEFAKDCALDIDTFGYDNAEQNLVKMANRCLLPNFRKKFFTAPWLEDRVNTVKQGLYRINSQTTGPTLVHSEGQTPNGYMWRVEVPIQRFYRQGDALKGNNQKVYVMDIYRVRSDAFNPVGLGINAINEVNAKR